MSLPFNIPTGFSLSILGIGGIKDIADALRDDGLAFTQNGITASTTQTQRGGTLIIAPVCRVTSANANDAVTLAFAAGPGMRFCIINDSGQTIRLFPKLGDKLNDAAIDALNTIADNTISYYYCPVARLWFGGASTLET